MTTHVRIAIVGGGFSGLGTGAQLKRNGIDDFVILERAADVGGVWRDNSYPGCAVDVESHLYSFSFAQDTDWSRLYSPQGEIWNYLQQCARDFHLEPHIRFNSEVRSATWDEIAQVWTIDTTNGRYEANILVSAAGALSEPSVPAIPGIEQFEGPAFHSANWNHDVELAGKRVAVIGTGASAVQFVPAIQPLVAHMHVYQRTAPWIIPRPDRALRPLERRLFARFPLARRVLRAWIYGVRELHGIAFRRPALMRILRRMAVRHLERSVADPSLRARLTPTYTIGCKRILLSNDYYPALAQPNVELVTDRIREVRAHSIVDENGVERDADAIVFGTGFNITELPLDAHIHGRRGVSLAEAFGPSPKAYLGTTVAGFPNFFLLQGPNTGLGHSSVIYMIEAQIAHIIEAIRYMDAHGAASVEPRPEAQNAFARSVDERMKNTVWLSGCNSWYLDSTGRNSAIWPGSTWKFRRVATKFDPRAYVTHTN